MTDRTPSPEWQRQADAEPYRIAAHITTSGRGWRWFSSWEVYDCRVEDAEPIATYRTRDEAIAYADRLNSAHAAADPFVAAADAAESAAALANLADLNARSMTDAALAEWTRHPSAAVRQIARDEQRRRELALREPTP